MLGPATARRRASRRRNLRNRIRHRERSRAGSRRDRLLRDAGRGGGGHERNDEQPRGTRRRARSRAPRRGRDSRRSGSDLARLCRLRIHRRHARARAGRGADRRGHRTGRRGHRTRGAGRCRVVRSGVGQRSPRSHAYRRGDHDPCVRASGNARDAPLLLDAGAFDDGAVAGGAEDTRSARGLRRHGARAPRRSDHDDHRRRARQRDAPAPRSRITRRRRRPSRACRRSSTS